MLLHFKCNFDPMWNYKKIAKDFFGDNKCLIVAEKMACNAHVHFQGYTDLSERAIEDTRAALTKTHFTYKAWEQECKNLKPGDERKGAPRPLKSPGKDRPINEKGFMYLCKEARPPLFSQGFTQEELLALRQGSEEHVQKLKTGLKEHLHGINYDLQPERAFKRMRLDALEYYEKEDKRPRPAFQKDVLWTMWTHPQRDDNWKEFVSEKI